MNKKLREKFLSQSLQSSRKSYYPQLMEQLAVAKENERQLQLLLDNLPARISYVDENMRYMFVNRGFGNLYGLSRRQVVGRRVASVMRRENFAKVEPHLKEALNGNPVQFETVLESSQGEKRWVEITLVPILDKGGHPKGFYSLAMDLTEKKQAEKERLASEERFRLLVENAPDGIYVRTGDRFVYLNQAAVRLFGAGSADELIGTPVLERFSPEYREEIAAIIEKMNQEKLAIPSRRRVYLRMDGSTVTVESSAIPMNFEGKDSSLVFMRDLTFRLKVEEEQQQLQEQLHQAQKMESVGRLAGGVAHDYNNFLSVIIGYAELSLMNIKPEEKLHKNLMEIIKAAERSKSVTGQLLAFARKETISPKVLDLNDTVENMLKMIRRLIGENIDLLWQPKAGLWPVEMDPSQVDQILANLCVNARDAIGGVGKIRIETGNRRVDQDFCNRHTGISPGDFVCLEVRDDGCGMDKATMGMIFDPFFTTKPQGKGTGLGLSTVYGIVRQNQGTIVVSSQESVGTSFSVYLPRCRDSIARTAKEAKEEIPKGKGETILVVEDEAMILKMTREILEHLGYQVLLAESPEMALEMAAKHMDGISMVISDVIMPGMNGLELVKRLQTINPVLKVLYMSGYTDNEISASGVLKPGVNFITKPFVQKDLAVKVRQVLS